MEEDKKNQKPEPTNSELVETFIAVVAFVVVLYFVFFKWDCLNAEDYEFNVSIVTLLKSIVLLLAANALINLSKK